MDRAVVPGHHGELGSTAERLQIPLEDKADLTRRSMAAITVMQEAGVGDHQSALMAASREAPWRAHANGVQHCGERQKR